MRTKPRSRLEIFEAILRRATKGAIKWHLQTGLSGKQLDVHLASLLELNMLRTDKHAMRICPNGRVRGVLYYTTSKGKRFLKEMDKLKLLLDKAHMTTFLFRGEVS